MQTMSSFLPPQKPPEGTAGMRSRRLPRCDSCWLPPSLCLCAELAPLSLRTRIVILIHHVERIKSSNTGRLVAKMVPDTIVHVHGDPTRAPKTPLPEGRVLLLWPDPNGVELSPSLAEDGPVVLIVPDGTWGQTRRMCRRDPAAKNATIVRLPEGHTTRYGGLRRSAREGTSSTMEAVARALGILEGPEVEARMLAAFDTFVERSLYVRTNGEIVAQQNGLGLTRPGRGRRD
jgi:DTW domain-containing protein